LIEGFYNDTGHCQRDRKARLPWHQYLCKTAKKYYTTPFDIMEINIFFDRDKYYL
jgi:hypothetical protein